MALTSGTKLGPYEIQSPLGAGGMGEVYRARDTRLDRTVAVKVLATHLSSSSELKQRLEREARAISSLNHPHICHLYDIGSHDGTDYLVMEFLEGETLAERLRKGPLPMTEVLKIGICIAEALSIAHGHGIVHRDLKPGNIMLTAGGAKLMDFGLAKPLTLQSSASGSATPPSFTAVATMSSPSPLSPLTTAGSIVGTIQYMSPEQIEGKEADARSDIFALGAVLYEMTSGKRPFSGKSQISLASSILESDPDPISTLKPETPPAFDYLVKTCLQKNPEDRFQTAQDIKLQLQWIATDKSRPPQATPTAPLTQGRLGWIVAAVFATVLVGLGIFLLARSPVQAPSIRTFINPPPNTRLNLNGDYAGPPVLSPDGSTLAFTATDADGKTTVWVRPMDAPDARVLAGTEDASFPFWSPDNRSLAFFADGKLKAVDLNGGAPQVIADAPFGRGGAWGADGNIVFAANTVDPITRVNASGGPPVQITHLDLSQHTSHRWPCFLPDGKHFLYLAIHHNYSKSANDTIYYASVDGRENRPLLHAQTNALYAAGYLLFARGDQLLAQSFDPGSGKLSGEPKTLAKGIMDDLTTWHMAASAADNGLLVFGAGGATDWQLVWVDRNGKEMSIVVDKLTNLLAAVISPQGDRIALDIDTGVPDVWVLDLSRNVRTRLTFGPVSNALPAWSPDGKWIAYTSNRNGRFSIYRKPSDGSGAEELLLSDDQTLIAADWSPDGKSLLYGRGSGGLKELWVMPLEGDRKPRLVLPSKPGVILFGASFSPDGHWLTYSSDESGTPEVFVVSFDGAPGKWQVSSSGGGGPKWSRDGKEIFYLGPTFAVFSTSVQEAGSTLRIGDTHKLVSRWVAPDVFYDVSPDGKKILLDRVQQEVSQSVTVVTNFASALKK